MAQNISTAVMQRRREPPNSLDFFPTPLWATRALCEWLKAAQGYLGSVLEPACGQGHMARALGEYFDDVTASDVFDYGYGGVDDFLFPIGETTADWTITNPPFRLGEQFVAEALRRSRIGVAVLVRTSFLEGVNRYGKLYLPMRPRITLQFAERVPMFKGRVLDPDVPARMWDERHKEWRLRKPSSATSYCWIIWKHRWEGRCEQDWIPPCRKRLTRPGDYDEFEPGRLAA